MSADEQARHWPHPVYANTDLLHARYVTHSFGRHRHRQYVFGVVTSGVEDFDYRGTLHHAVPGTLSVVDADAVHTGQPGEPGGWRYEVLYVDTDLVADVAGGRRPSFPQGLVHDQQAVDAFLRAHAAAASGDRLAASETARAAVTLAVRRYGRPARTVATPADPGTRHVNRCVELLHARMADPPSVDELAQLAGCSPFALTRAFRRHVGLPPHAYLTQARVERARTLLTAGAEVAATAQEVGFADQAHLTRHFRRHIGVPPARFARERRIVQEIA
ncbi:MAG TPA: AraC family transcriptional regulator [Jatrophihabitantaceae bacterium]|jgi:AraC-like DNA-binding protein